MNRITRVWKARGPAGQCPLCGRAILGGDHVAKVGKTGSWVHRACLIIWRRRRTPTPQTDSPSA